MVYDVIVIGAGLAGLVAATRLAQAGRRVLILAKGVGCTHVSTGCVDVLGYLQGEEVASPREALSEFLTRYPDHPYRHIGLSGLEEALSYFRRECEEAGWPYKGDLTANWRLPTAAGAARPTCLAPDTMTAGDLRRQEPLLLVGFRELRDFYPRYAAANLRRLYGLEARGAYLDLPSLSGQENILATDLARAFDTASFRREVLRALKPILGEAQRVGFPAALGLRGREAFQELSAETGRAIFEVPTLPPSVPGVRLFEAWRARLSLAGGRMQLGFPVVEAEIVEGRVQAVLVQSASRRVRFAAERFVLATGGLYGHGLLTDHTGAMWEPIFRLPVHGVPDPAAWTAAHPLEPHPIQRAGLVVDEALRPLDERGRVVLENVHVAGALLAGGTEPRAGIGDGISIATGYRAAQVILGHCGT